IDGDADSVEQIEDGIDLSPGMEALEDRALWKEGAEIGGRFGAPSMKNRRLPAQAVGLAHNIGNDGEGAAAEGFVDMDDVHGAAQKKGISPALCRNRGSPAGPPAWQSVL